MAYDVRRRLQSLNDASFAGYFIETCNEIFWAKPKYKIVVRHNYCKYPGQLGQGTKVYAVHSKSVLR